MRAKPEGSSDALVSGNVVCGKCTEQKLHLSVITKRKGEKTGQLLQIEPNRTSKTRYNIILISAYIVYIVFGEVFAS